MLVAIFAIESKDTLILWPARQLFLEIDPMNLLIVQWILMMKINESINSIVFLSIHPTPDLSHPHLAKTRVYQIVRPGPNFISFISLLMNPAFNKPGFKGNSDLLNQVFGP